MAGHLGVIDGGAAQVRIGPVLVQVAPQGNQPFPVNAIVREEDTYQALSAPPVIRLPLEHPIRTVTDAWGAKPLEPGTVLVRGGNPTELVAVIYDLDAEPICAAEWIEQALDQITKAVAGRGIRSLVLPLLGVKSPDISVRRRVNILCHGLSQTGWPGRVWLVVEPELTQRVHDVLLGHTVGVRELADRSTMGKSS